MKKYSNFIFYKYFTNKKINPKTLNLKPKNTINPIQNHLY